MCGRLDTLYDQWRGVAASELFDRLAIPATADSVEAFGAPTKTEIVPLATLFRGPPPPAVSTPETAPEVQMQVDQGSAAPEPAPVTGNGPGRPAPAPADSWEDKADLSSTATTPEDEDMSMEDDTGEKTVGTDVCDKFLRELVIYLVTLPS